MRNINLFLVTGASGFLGHSIVQQLIDRNKKVRVLVLPNDKHKDIIPKGVEIIIGNVLDKSSLKGFFKGDMSKACLIHCAGIISIASKKDKLLWDVNVKGSQNILDISAKKKMGKVIFVSSVHSFKPLKHHKIIKEPTSYNYKKVSGQYGKSKAMVCEHAVRLANKGLNVSIVLPSGIIGPDDFMQGSITKTVKNYCNNKLGYAVKKGYDFVDVRDVARGIISCAYHGRKAESYLLTNRYVSLKEVFDYIHSKGYGKHMKYVPLWLIKIVAPIIEYRTLKRKESLFLSKESVRVLSENSNYSHEKALKELDFHPRSIYETLDDLIAWLKESKQI